MTLHTLFSTVSYCSVLWFIICSTTARTKTENIGSEQKKNEEKQPIIFYLIVYLSFPFCDVFIFLYPTYFCFFSYLISYLRPISSSKITSTYRFRWSLIWNSYVLEFLFKYPNCSLLSSKNCEFLISNAKFFIMGQKNVLSFVWFLFIELNNKQVFGVWTNQKPSELEIQN